MRTGYDQEGCSVLHNQGQGSLSNTSHPFLVTDQGLWLLIVRLKQKNKLDQILMPVIGVSTVNVGVTTLVV